MTKRSEERRKTYRLPVGPQHPMYVEAENLAVTLDGETITKVDVNIGYMHRGIEELMQRRNYIQGIYLSERICGICSGIHSMTYSQVVENLLSLEIPERAKLIRMIVLELERLHSHLLFLGNVTLHRNRVPTHILDFFERLVYRPGQWTLASLFCPCCYSYISPFFSKFYGYRLPDTTAGTGHYRHFTC